MIPHPTKTDTWIEGKRSAGPNLCEEILIPGGSDTGLCTLGVKPSMLEYAGLTYIHQAQVHAKVRLLLEHDKIINSFYSGATPAQLMAELDVEALAVKLIAEHEDDLTQLDYSLETLRSHYYKETLKLFGSFAVNNSLKEKGLMLPTNPTIATEDTQELVAAVKAATEKLSPTERFVRTNLELVDQQGEDHSRFLAHGAHVDEPVPTEKDFINLRRSARGALTKSGERKRKKSKAKSGHVPNCKARGVKSLLGASILMRLGAIQQQTQDTQKKALLKELPLADVVELATGDKLPDYQANLLNKMQAKADPEAPVVKRMGEYYKETMADDAPNDPAVQELLDVGKNVVETATGIMVQEMARAGYHEGDKKDGYLTTPGEEATFRGRGIHDPAGDQLIRALDDAEAEVIEQGKAALEQLDAKKEGWGTLRDAYNGVVATDERIEQSDQLVEALYPGTLEREAKLGRGNS